MLLVVMKGALLLRHELVLWHAMFLYLITGRFWLFYLGSFFHHLLLTEKNGLAREASEVNELCPMWEWLIKIAKLQRNNVSPVGTGSAVQ